MEHKAKMDQLIKELNMASDAYYNTGNTIMSDKEFDSKLKELELLEKESGIVMSNSPTQRVGAPVLTKLDKVTHEHKPMLSLSKVHSAEEIIKFANGKELIAMIKLDGLSVRLTYHYGVLSRAETRGNGIEGSDITLHVKQFENVPLVINNKAETYMVDGEAIISESDFEAINAALPEGTEKFKNARNLASGTLSLLDTSLVKERHLRFILWDVIAGDDSELFNEKICNARDLGFTTTLMYSCPMNSIDIEQININVLNEAKEKGMPCDGVVWKLNDIKYGESLGQTSHHFNNAVAFKFQDDVYETTLREIEYSMGKTGILTPVAIFDPVEIEGTEVSRASVHNISILTDLELSVGDTITVYKANMIIPQIAENLSAKERSKQAGIGQMEYVRTPGTCPICGKPTEIRKDNDTLVLVCTNDNCKGKLLGRLSHAVSKNALDIDGMSEATLEYLISKGWVKSIKDLYYLQKVKNEWIKCDGFGKRSVEKLLQNIEKSRETTLDKFLYAQSIPLIGRSASKDIANHCQNDIEAFCGLMNEEYDFTIINGFGKEMQKSLVNWWENNNKEFMNLLKEFVFESTYEVVVDKKLEGKIFVITGALNHFENRDQLKELLESLGAKVSGSVSSKTFALICNENAGTSKSKKAASLGVPVWTEEQLLEYIR